MKIIIPMAGYGKRLRPHTLSIPKPLIPLAGKPIVERLISTLAEMSGEPISEIAFVVGRFGEKVETSLKKAAADIGARASLYYQDEPLGTAHALLCAAESLDGPLVVAFADTLFVTDFRIDKAADGLIWVKKVEDWKSFGVVKLGKDGAIDEFVEKPDKFVSDLAIVGIYYFRDGEKLLDELRYLIDNDIRDKGEYQLTSALANLRDKGLRFYPARVDQWLDCGNKDATVDTNRHILEFIKDKAGLISPSHRNEDSLIVEPCYIGEKVALIHSIVGPYVSLGEHTLVENSVIRNSIIQSGSTVKNKVIANSMIGNYVKLNGTPLNLSLGDYVEIVE